jgi:hypothetical protein
LPAAEPSAAPDRIPLEQAAEAYRLFERNAAGVVEVVLTTDAGMRTDKPNRDSAPRSPPAE